MIIRLILGMIALFLCFQSSFSQHLVSQTKANRLFNSGRTLVRHGEIGAAKEQFQDFLRITPTTDLRLYEAQYYEVSSALTLYNVNGEKKANDFVAKYSTDSWSPMVYYDMAHYLYERKKYEKAIFYFEKIDFSTLSEELYIAGKFHWGYSLFNLRKLDEALEQFNFIKFLKSPFNPASNYYSGFVLLKNGDFDNALKDLKRAKESKSYASIVPYMIASIYYKQNKYDQFLIYVNTLKGEELANREKIDMLVAEVHFRNNNYKSAFEGFQNYFKSENISIKKNLLFKAGFSAYSTEQYDKALQYLKKLPVDADSIGFYASYYLGALYLKKNLKPLALNAFEYAAKYTQNPKVVEESLYQRAKILYDIGRYDVAIEALQKISDEYPSNNNLGEVKRLLSQAYVNVANYDKTIGYIEALPTRTPAINKIYQKATWMKGVELFNKESYAQAVYFFKKSLEYPIDKNYVAEASFWSGEAYSIGGKYDQAIPHYLHVTSLPNYTNATLISRTRYAIGYALFNLKRYERALYNFKKFVDYGRKNINYSDGVLRLADCYYVTKLYTKALSNYQKYIRIGTVDKDYALLQLGVILGIQQQYKKAIESLNQVIKEYPQSQFIDEARFQKAQLDFEQGNYAVAISGFTTLINAHPSSLFLPYAYMRRAASYYNLKKYDKTIADYITVLNKYISHSISKSALLPLQEALGLEGREKEFESYLTKYKSSNPNSEGIESIEFETAQHLYFNQDYQGAIKGFKNYIDAYPKSARLIEVKYYQAESYFRLKDYAKSLAIHKQVSTDLTFSLLNKSISRMAELEYKMNNYQNAVTSFGKLSNIASTKKEKLKAWIGMMDSYFMLHQYDSSDFYANIILNKGKADIGATGKASLFLGKSAVAQKKYELAQDELINTLNIAQDEYGAEAKYLLGKVFFLTKDHKQCYETLIGINTDFAPYTEWVGKAFLLLSDNFIAVDDIFQAKGTLNSLVKGFPLESIRLKAQQKLEEIEAGTHLKKSASQQDSLIHQTDDQK